MTTIIEVVSKIADTAAGIMAMSSKMGVVKSPAEALHFTAKSLISRGNSANSRSGVWSSETTCEQIEEALWFASVAQDILDNTFRPSTGPVGDYALGQVIAIARGDME